MKTPDSRSNLMKADEAARLLGLACKTIRKLTSERRIPHIKISARCVRYDRVQLEEWLQSRSVRTRNE